MVTKGVPKRDRSGRFTKGIIPANKIVLPERKLKSLYRTRGAEMIARYFGISKQTVLRNLKEYNISRRPSGAPPKLPSYWKQALRKPKSKPAWSKGRTKEVDSRLKRISESLKGAKNHGWKPEIHAGELVECACGCGRFRSKYDKKGRRRYYIAGHGTGGRFKKGLKPWNKGKHWPPDVVHRMLTIRSPNREETMLIQLFKEYNFPYKFVGDGQVIIGGRNPDFINVNGEKKIIEFFGEHWHPLEDEEIKREVYAGYGFKMLGIWGKDTKDRSMVVSKIREFEEVK